MPGGLPTLEEVRAEIRKLDPTLKPGDPYFDTAVFLMAAFKGVGQSDVALAKFTGLSRGFLIRRIKNLRQEGIWSSGELNHSWYGPGGRIEFRLDIKAAEGELDDEGRSAEGEP